MKALVPHEAIERKIFLIREQKVMLSFHLAELYGVETRALNQAVKRNINRFPQDFTFRLNKSEAKLLVSQNVIPHKRYFGGSLPYAFTQEGIAMLSSVLNSERAIHVNIAIMRTFTKLRKILESHKELLKKIEDMEAKYDGQFQIVFKAIRKLMAPPPAKKKRIIGFQPPRKS